MTKKDDIEVGKQLDDRHVAISQQGVEIRHRGKPITVEMAGLGVVYLVIDCSGSMQVIKGATDFAREARRKGYSVGLIQFSDDATHLCEPVREISALEKHLRSLDLGGYTHMAEAILLADEKLAGRKGKRVMVIATDGMPNGHGEPNASLNIGKAVKEKGIDIIVIGTDDADRDFLKRLASRSELGVKVPTEQLGQSIASTAKILPQLGEGRPEK
jgi:Mg-chelatase subunit ChlD